MTFPEITDGSPKQIDWANKIRAKHASTIDALTALAVEWSAKYNMADTLALLRLTASQAKAAWWIEHARGVSSVTDILFPVLDRWIAAGKIGADRRDQIRNNIYSMLARVEG